MRQKLKLLNFILIVGLCFNLHSQISITPSVGCLPGISNANFVYSGSLPASNVSWNFGDGSPVSNLTNPQHSYLGQGSYTVTFTATIGGSLQTFTALVVVHPAPNGNFTASLPQSGCAPMTVSFQATSSNSNVAFIWDYGDNTLGNGGNSSHAYNSQGIFTPILTIQNTLTGCFLNVSGSSIPVSSIPSVIISSNPGLFSCTLPFTTAFSASNSTSGSPLSPPGLSYIWNFGNGQNSTMLTPGNITYTSQGNFTVTLTATDNNPKACSRTTSVLVTVITPSVDVIVPQAVCIVNQDIFNMSWPNFTALVSSSQPTTTWQMGDGKTKIIPSPNYNPPVYLSPGVMKFDTIHFYTTPGVKIVTISATAGTCVTSITRTIMVQEITPNFTVVPASFVCTPSLVLTYTNLSTVNYSSNLSYSWTASHWNQNAASAYTSNAVHPSFTVTQGSNNPYTIYNVYSPTITLAVESNTPHCAAKISHTIDRIRRPTAWFNMDKSEGCAPLTVTFRDSSFTDPVLFPISSYTWNNGAAGINSMVVTGSGSNIPNFVFTYTANGTYSPFLSIQTQGGCSHTSFLGSVTVVNPPSINFMMPTSPVCAGVPVQFSLSAGPGENVQHWHIESDFGFFSDCVSNQLPQYAFNNPGVHGFTVSAYQNSCKSTLTLSPTFTVTGPVTNGRYATNCVNKKNVVFFYHLQDATSGMLEFGDAQTYSITGIPGSVVTGSVAHSYSASGNYTAFLRANNSINSCGPFTHSMLVTVREIVVDFTVTPIICKGSSPTVSVQAADIQTGCGRGYTWFYDNLPPEQTTNTVYIAYNTFTNVGNHSLKLLVRDVNGCTAQLTKPFRVSNPAPSFTFNSNPICVSNMPVQIQNLTPQLPDAVPNYTWNMGDGSPGSTIIATNNPTSSPTYTYYIGASQSKTINVTLTAKNTIGCIEKISHSLTVNDPIAFFTYIPDKCIGQPVNFNVLGAPSHTNYLINFGDQSSVSTTSITVLHNYLGPGFYSPTLTVSDNAGCVKSYSQPFEVQLYPQANFTMISVPERTFALADNYCLPLTVSLTSTSFSPSLLSYYWNIGNGGPGTTSPNYTAGGTYTNTGVFTITLTASTTAGCSSTKTKTIKVFNPKADFELLPADKKLFCFGDPITVNFKNRTAEESYWQWDFGDNTVQPILNSNFTLIHSHAPVFFPEQSNGILTVLLTAYSSGSPAACKSIATKTVQIIRVNPDFKRNLEVSEKDWAHCLGLRDNFSNLTRSNSSNSLALTYSWEFGNGSSSQMASPSYKYPVAGQYTVSLKADDPLTGCKNVTVKNMTIFPLPVANFTLKDLSCPDSAFVIEGSGSPGISGTLSGTLLPSPGSFSFSNINTFSLVTSAKQSTTYSLTVRDENDCESNPVYRDILIQKEPRKINWDTTIVVGQQASLNAYSGSNFTYTWTPEISNLNCLNCYNPVSSSTVDITYSVVVTDHPLGCFETTNTFRIKILPKSSLDVPTAFTPNGDGVNDIIYADGWGIKKLIYFRIYDRWGQLLFETEDLKIGWDGRYQGVIQNIETYVYQVEAENYLNERINKSGTFKLIR
jgi:gliding motility-associated-like protein